jgi:hypothetical protein
MPDHKNQHFVPKCLLRQFAPDEEKRSLNVGALCRTLLSRLR